MSAERQTSPTHPASSSTPVGIWQRGITLVLVLALLAGMVFALASCKKQRNSNDLPAAEQKDQREVTVFFTKSRGSNSVTEAVVRPLPQEEKITPIQYALESLLQGPTQDERRAGFFSEIPKGTKLLSVNKKDNKVIVNFSSQFASGGGSNSILQRMAEIQNTIIANNQGQSSEKPLNIQVLVNDKPVQTLGGEGLEVPETANQKIQ
ncbi:MAG: GerMN domain-containing protein [Vampirovibrionales bacterium]|nr:GerMN domain-containing protein [Vampirovibrionales bacterium]